VTLIERRDSCRILSELLPELILEHVTKNYKAARIGSVHNMQNAEKSGGHHAQFARLELLKCDSATDNCQSVVHACVQINHANIHMRQRSASMTACNPYLLALMPQTTDEALC
jgi:hypothetical protein